jgi:hypothetical protein
VTNVFLGRFTDLFRSVLLNVLACNKMSFRSFFDKLKVESNKTIYWGVDELLKIDLNFGFGIESNDYEHLI